MRPRPRIAAMVKVDGRPCPRMNACQIARDPAQMKCWIATSCEMPPMERVRLPRRSRIRQVRYIGRRIVGSADALAGVDACLREFGIVAVTREVLLAARALSGSDFEDDVQMACAQAAEIQLIVTRDVTGFAMSPIRAIEPGEISNYLSH